MSRGASQGASVRFPWLNAIHRVNGSGLAECHNIAKIPVQKMHLGGMSPRKLFFQVFRCQLKGRSISIDADKMLQFGMVSDDHRGMPARTERAVNKVGHRAPCEGLSHSICKHWHMHTSYSLRMRLRLDFQVIHFLLGKFHVVVVVFTMHAREVGPMTPLPEALRRLTCSASGREVPQYCWRPGAFRGAGETSASKRKREPRTAH